LSTIYDIIGKGQTYIQGQKIDVNALPWNEHATFKGVYLKHLITSKDTEGKLSCHIVKVTAGNEIGTHVHVGKYELHEVITGEGTGILEDQEMAYKPGVTAVMPPDKKHRVVANQNQDVILLAKFFPALL
jgi:quercetin dioxygenase-like cupin family protein